MRLVPQEPVDLALGQELDEPRQRVGDRDHAQADDQHRVDPLGGRAHGPDLAEADPRDRDHHHEQRVERGPAQHDVAEHPEDDHRLHRREPDHEATDRGAPPEAGEFRGRGVGHRRSSDKRSGGHGRRGTAVG